MLYRRRHIGSKIRQLRKSKRFFQRPIFWFALLAMVTVGAAIYFYLFFPKTQVLQVQISGNETLESKDIEAVAWENILKPVMGLKSASIFKVNKKELQSHVLGAFPALEKASIQKDFFNRIVVSVVERAPVGVFCGNTQYGCFFIDAAGIVFDPIATAPQDVIIFRGKTEVTAGQAAVGKNIIEAVLSIEKNLKNNFQIDVKEAMVSSPLIIKTSERWKIYLDPAADINLQISKMNALLNEIPIASRKRLQYIYLQYKDRAYYKYVLDTDIWRSVN